MVFFETPSGGAVFSVGSITWFGSLSHNDYDNPVSRITDNVLRAFASEQWPHRLSSPHLAPTPQTADWPPSTTSAVPTQ